MNPRIVAYHAVLVEIHEDGRMQVRVEDARLEIVDGRLTKVVDKVVDNCMSAPIGPPSDAALHLVEDRKYGVPRIDVLRRIPAVVRFLSIEPLLEDLGDLDLTGIDWVIVGGESGSGARPFAVEWCRRIVDQCRAQDVPVFVKQPGNRPTAAGELVQVRKKSDRTVLARYGLDVREWPKIVQEVAGA